MCPKKYLYFVSYAHDSGFGNCTVKVEGEITSPERTREVEAQISAENRSGGRHFAGEAVLISFQLLKEVEDTGSQS